MIRPKAKSSFMNFMTLRSKFTTGCKILPFAHKSRDLVENKSQFVSLVDAIKQDTNCESFNTFIHSHRAAPVSASLFPVNSQFVEEDQFTFVDNDHSLSSDYSVDNDDTDLLSA